MKRYIISKQGAQYLGLKTEDAVKKLATSVTITGEQLAYKNIDLVAAALTEEQSHNLRMKGYKVISDEKKPITFQGSDYEKVRSLYVKAQRRKYTGAGVKVAVLDTGCATNYVPVDFKYNFFDNNTLISDFDNHGTKTTSVIKSATIGLAPGCEMHHLKISSGGFSSAGTITAALDYCITNEISIINMSFQFDSSISTALTTTIAAGIVLAAACGNSAEDAETLYPASHTGVIAVNSIREDGTPRHKNWIAPSGGHGVDISCAGSGSEIINNAGTTQGESGTSFSCPFFVGAFAIYKQALGITDNYAVLNHMKKRAFAKHSDPIIKNTLNF